MQLKPLLLPRPHPAQLLVLQPEALAAAGQVVVRVVVRVAVVRSPIPWQVLWMASVWYRSASK